jgi:hypothetical protein
MNTCVVYEGLSCVVSEGNDTGYAAGTVTVIINYANGRKLNMGYNTT